MNRTPMILGAVAAATCLGVTVGATVPTEPLTRANDALAEIPQHAPTPVDFEQAAKPMPNHYPLETPEGRIEVAELSDYGLYRNRRFQAQYGQYRYQPAAYEQRQYLVSGGYQQTPQEPVHQQAFPASSPSPSEVAGNPLLTAETPAPPEPVVAADDPLASGPVIEIAHAEPASAAQMPAPLPARMPVVITE